jgi:bifunctional non-homologous end joining protein LigD
LAKRKKTQVYVDWMQNARGKSLAAVYTARAKPKATISMPLTWKQIEQGVRITDFTVINGPQLLAKKDAWADFFDNRQTMKLR